jgi:hypothetical protein
MQFAQMRGFLLGRSDPASGALGKRIESSDRAEANPLFNQAGAPVSGSRGPSARKSVSADLILL